MKLSIVVPAHNEAENITEIIDKIEQSVKLTYELVVVNDHSEDNTYALAAACAKEYPNILLVENRLSAGFANAILTGFRSSTGDAVIPVMADLCDDLSSIKEMFDKLIEGYDVVAGARYIRGGRRIGGSRIKAFLSYFAGWSLHFLLGVPTHDIANAFKMYRKTVIDTVEISACGFEVSMEIPLKAYYAGFKITEVPTVWKEREKGKSSFKMFKLIPNYGCLYLWAIKKRMGF